MKWFRSITAALALMIATALPAQARPDPPLVEILVGCTTTFDTALGNQPPNCLYIVQLSPLRDMPHLPPVGSYIEVKLPGRPAWFEKVKGYIFGPFDGNHTTYNISVILESARQLLPAKPKKPKKPKKPEGH